ncbi:MAG TPA: methionine adenosyltransferase [Gemmatimonadales bacterium]|nr:methionine adenosyltransferase [Gemmatimonadales bacterium]
MSQVQSVAAPRTRPAPAVAPDLLTAESVTEGHPDKVADFIADSILDAYLAADPAARVAVEVLVKNGFVIVAGEVTAQADIPVERVVRDAIRHVGYLSPDDPFNAQGVEIRQFLSRQSREIARGVGNGKRQGAGDQGLMVGYATSETPALMPLPIVLAHALTRQLATARRAREVDWLGPDGKAQVSVSYADGRPIEVSRIVVSTQHQRGVERATLEAWVRDALLPAALKQWHNPKASVDVNPSGSFVRGGPSADCGVTGRKIVVDTYGGAARHGGGAFSGKDPSKVDRSAAYFARWAARQVLVQGLARRAEVEVAYAIGKADPIALHVETFGTGDQAAATELVRSFDFSPAGIIEQLDLRRPIYRLTTNYGHFGKPGLPWENGA